MEVIIFVDLRDANDNWLQTLEINPETLQQGFTLVVRNSLMRSLAFYREGTVAKDESTPDTPAPETSD